MTVAANVRSSAFFSSAMSPLKSNAINGTSACCRMARSMDAAVRVLPLPTPPIKAACGLPPAAFSGHDTWLPVRASSPTSPTGRTRGTTLTVSCDAPSSPPCAVGRPVAGTAVSAIRRQTSSLLSSASSTRSPSMTAPRTQCARTHAWNSARSFGARPACSTIRDTHVAASVLVPNRFCPRMVMPASPDGAAGGSTTDSDRAIARRAGMLWLPKPSLSFRRRRRASASSVARNATDAILSNCNVAGSVGVIAQIPCPGK